MTGFLKHAKEYHDPEKMAADYLRVLYGDDEIIFPINPFHLLRQEGVPYFFRNFKKLEGVYIPAETNDDLPIVAINAKRPITRQRFTAAHELCHHFRDAERQVSCPIGSKDAVEKFANAFAAAILMPADKLKEKVREFQNKNGVIAFEDVLKIAEFFGVSFEACLYRIAYKLHAIEGDTSPMALQRRIKKFRPEAVRKNMKMSNAALYAMLIDDYASELCFQPDNYSRYLFEHSYIYNDSRMEGMNVEIEEAAEIVTDLRMNAQNSRFCTEENEVYMSIAGHYRMYQSIFELPVKDTISVFDAILLNRDLFSYYPYQGYGGSTRQTNTLVEGARFETTDYNNIYPELIKVDQDIKEYFIKKDQITASEYIKHVVRVHHKLTTIHPFPDGNGRTSRAFMNLQLVRAGFSPVYIKVEQKQEYIDALETADKENNHDDLYEVIFRIILQVHADINSVTL